VHYSSLGLEELIQSCVETMEPAAWDEFIRRFNPLICSVILRITRAGRVNVSNLDDLTQEIYLKLCANNCRLLRDFRPTEMQSIFGFIKVVTANVVRDHFRASVTMRRGGSRRIESLGSNVSPRQDLTDAAMSVDRHVLMREVEDNLNKIAPGKEHERERTIFWLYYQQGIPATAIAKLPGIGVASSGVESIIYRLTKALRTEMSSSVLA
jgi:RNA polymerase sigma-70 factor (ECF subfamily)